MTAMACVRNGNMEDTNAATSCFGSLVGAGPGGIPGLTDNVTNSTFISTVGVGASVTLGRALDDETTFDLLLSGAGQFVINGTLTCKGNIDVTAGGVINVNGTLVIDAGARTTPKQHLLRCGNTGSGKLVVGPGGVVTTPGAGLFWRQQSGAGSNSGQLDLAGVAGSRASLIRLQANGSNNAWVTTALTAASASNFRHCTLDACGDFQLIGTGVVATNVDYATFKNSVGSCNIVLNITGASATYSVQHSTFDKNPNSGGQWQRGANFTVLNENYFAGGWTILGAGGYPTGWNIKRSIGANFSDPFNPLAAGSIVSHELLWCDKPSGNNTDGAGINPNTAVAGLMWAQSVISEDGSVTKPSGSASAENTTVQDCYFLANSDGGKIGMFAAQLGSASVGNVLRYRRNSGAVTFSGTSAHRAGESAITPAGRYAEISSGLYLQIKAQAFAFPILASLNGGAQSVNNPFLVAASGGKFNYNTIFATGVSSPATTYAAAGNSATQDISGFGTNDSYIDPQCIEPLRNPQYAASYLGNRFTRLGVATSNAQTYANAHAIFLALHDGTFPTSYTDNAIQLALTHIRRGWMPQNVAVRTIAEGGHAPGAFGAFAPTVSAVSITSSTAGTSTQNVPDGLRYWVLTNSTITPGYDQIQAGKDHTGAAATRNGSDTITATGAKVITWTTPPTATYTLHVCHAAADAFTADVALRTSVEVSSAPVALGAAPTLALSNASPAPNEVITLTVTGLASSVGNTASLGGVAQQVLSETLTGGAGTISVRVVQGALKYGVSSTFALNASEVTQAGVVLVPAAGFSYVNLGASISVDATASLAALANDGGVTAVTGDQFEVQLITGETGADTSGVVVFGPTYIDNTEFAVRFHHAGAWANLGLFAANATGLAPVAATISAAASFYPGQSVVATVTGSMLDAGNSLSISRVPQIVTNEAITSGNGTITFTVVQGDNRYGSPYVLALNYSIVTTLSEARQLNVAYTIEPGYAYVSLGATVNTNAAQSLAAAANAGQTLVQNNQIKVQLVTGLTGVDSTGVPIRTGAYVSGTPFDVFTHYGLIGWHARGQFAFNVAGNLYSVLSSSAGSSSSRNKPATDAFVITPSDTVNFAQPCRGIYVGGAGDISIVTWGNSTVMISAPAAGRALWIPVRRVNVSGTTATSLVGLT